MGQKVLWIFLFFFFITVAHGQGGHRGRADDEQQRNPWGTNYGSPGNQRPNEQFSNHRESEHNQRPNQQYSSGYTNIRETELNQRPTQQSSLGNNRETEYNQRPNEQHSSGQYNNMETEYNQKPNQHPSNNRETNTNQHALGLNNNQRPSSSSFSHQIPNQQTSGHNTNNREPDYVLKPNQHQKDKVQNQQSNNRENEYNQRPGLQQSNSERQPGGNQYAQRPPTMGSLQPEGSKPLCYGLFGCYSQSEPWTSKLRPVPAPLPPENNSASFYFYSRPNIEQRYLLNVYPEFSLGDAKFDARRPTIIIIHGFIQTGDELWMEEMKNAYLKHVDANVMIVDWGKGSRRLSYLQAAGNTRLIGSMTSFLIKRLMEGHHADPSTFHLIGHSLGAHVASYTGKEVPGIGRITALDPAQPGFEGFDKSVRLDKSDAQFVDVVHTNAKPFIPTLGLGMIKPHGHVDFYMNGGFDQPLCISPPQNAINDVKSILDLANLPIDWFSQTFFCDHARAYSYLIEAFNNTDCVFWGHKANLKNVAQGIANTLTQGLLAKYVALSSSCNKDDCIPLGFNTLQSNLRGSYVVTTNGQFPYCRSEKGVSSQRDSKKKDSKGKNI